MAFDLDNELPIVINLDWQQWAFTHIPENVVQALAGDQAARRYKTTKRINTFAKALECFLQVRGLAPLGDDCLTSGELAALFPQFVGAVYSKRLFGPEVSLQSRYKYVRALHSLLQRESKRQKKQLAPALRELYPRVGQPPSGAEGLIADFCNAPISEWGARLWRGWPAWSSAGKRQWLPLHTVYRKLGSNWTERLYQSLVVHARGTRQEFFPGLLDLCSFISVRPGINAELLTDRAFCTSFWQDFWVFYLKEAADRGSHRNAVTKWKNHFRSFAERLLIGSGLFAAPYGDFPGPWGGHRTLNQTSSAPVADDEVDGTLLVEIPEDVSDEAAWQFLLIEIPRSVSAVRAWAEAKTDFYWQLHRRRKQLASAYNHGGHKTSAPFDELHLAAAAATYETLGHPADLGTNIRTWFPQRLDVTAAALGIPQRGTFIPFAALLIVEHPSITGSFLEHLEVWDKNGKLVGLRVENGVTYLRGYKYRRGRRLAEMQVRLTRTSLRAVQRILALTRHLRDYLRSRGKDEWRFLLLTARSFGVPQRVRRFAGDCMDAQQKTRMQREMASCGAASEQQASNLAEKFTLRALRKTCGLLTFVNTHSERRVSEVLGHAEFNPNLLARYLPPALVAFFRARWIRAFQAGLLAVVLDGSKHKLRAVGVQSEDRLGVLLSRANIAAMREMLTSPVGDAFASPAEASEGDKLIFAASTDSFRFAIAAANSAPLSGEEMFWHEFSKHLLGVVKARQGLDPELDECLRIAEAL